MALDVRLFLSTERRVAEARPAESLDGPVATVLGVSRPLQGLLDGLQTLLLGALLLTPGNAGVGVGDGSGQLGLFRRERFSKYSLLIALAHLLLGCVGHRSLTHSHAGLCTSHAADGLRVR